MRKYGKLVYSLRIGNLISLERFDLIRTFDHEFKKLAEETFCMDILTRPSAKQTKSTFRK